MRLTELENYGLPRRIIDIWRQRQGETLLPVQIRALRKGLLGKGGGLASDDEPSRLIVSAPTSSGKSFCAEMAAVRELMHRRRTVMLFPLKSLAEQKYSLVQSTYGPLGIKCLVVSGDHPENDEPFAQGKYQVALVINEKFDRLLTFNLDMLANIGLVVVDELQTIADPSRGPVLEMLLTKILASEYRPSLLGLSAVIGDGDASAGRLAKWLDATLVEEMSRPVDLIRGVAAEGSFRYRSYNSGLDGSEEFTSFDVAEEPVDGFIRHLKSSHAATLVFLKSRSETVEAANRLAAAVKWPAANMAMSRLDDEEPSFLVRSLKRALSRGVAFHNSDLSQGQRDVVEHAFVDGEVRVIFSTTTLAMGVDFPADTVYLETVKYTSGCHSHRPCLVPLSRSEFENMSGRAGRLGARDDGRAGRAVVLAESEFDRDVLWESYIAGESPCALSSALPGTSWDDRMLDIICSGLAVDVAGLERWLEKTFYARCGDAPCPDIDHELESLSEQSLIEYDTNCLEPTPLGRAVAHSGLRISQARHLADQLAKSQPSSPTGWLALALSAPDWPTPPGMLSRYEQASGAPLRGIYQDYDHLLSDLACVFGETGSRQALTFRAAATLKALQVLDQWQRLTPVLKLEERFQMHLGQIMSLGEAAAHLVGGLAAILRAGDADALRDAMLQEMVFSLRFGVPASMRELYQALGSRLNRSDYAALKTVGLGSLRDLTTVSEEILRTTLLSDAKILLINNIVESLKLEVDMERVQTNVVVNNPAGLFIVGDTPGSIEVDGSNERERFLVMIDGFPVLLTGKSFKYFVRLAWARVHDDSGWLYKEDIEVGFNQARYLYRMKNEIKACLKSNWSVVENNRLGYYRLKIDPTRIKINTTNLREHPDFEVRQLLAEAVPQTVN